jgi:cytochrome bd-type quinol oxidase subunit 2
MDSMHRVPALVLFGLTIVCAFATLIYSWQRWAGGSDEQKSLWRRAITACGISLVTAQAFLLVAFWVFNIYIGGWSNDYPLFKLWARIELVLFALALPCVLVGSARRKWWLLLSSTLLFGICFLVAISM